MKVDTNPKKIKELLERAIKKIYPSKKALEKLLKSGRRLRVYYGVDPTAPHLHLDHGTNLLILRRFQDLGHQVIFLIGDFTAQIGDPSGRLSPRVQLSEKEVLRNCKNYKKQAGKILDFQSKKNPAKVVYNSKWLKKMNLQKMLELMSKMTHSRIIARDMFQQRIEQGKEIYLNEFIYPLLQGYDSVVLDVDVEVGGSDQIFNMLVGRDLLRIYRKKEKFVMAKELLAEPKTGKILMSKSEGRYIALDETPNQMYGKIMALPDEVIGKGLEHWTMVPFSQVKKIAQQLEKGKINPQDSKAFLAREVVKLYYGVKASEKAEEEFKRVFKEKKLPSKIPVFKTSKKEIEILDLLCQTGLSTSRSQAKRLILQGGVKIDGKIKTNWKEKIKIKRGMIIQVGKRRFIKIKC